MDRRSGHLSKGRAGEGGEDPRRATAGGEGALSDSELAVILTAAARGDEAAWRKIVDLYARRVYGLCKSRLGGGKGGGSEIAEEVTQSVFCTVASKLAGGEYVEQGRFEAWLFRVAMNRIRDEVRRTRRQAAPTDPANFGSRTGTGRDTGGGSGTPSFSDTEETAALRSAMEQLPEADRDIVELRHHAGMSFKQIAELVEEPIGTLLARHHRALRKLKELLTHPPTAAAKIAGPRLSGDGA